MNETFRTYLSRLQRLGKIEREELRTILSDGNTHEEFVRTITRLIANSSSDDDATLEDMFIFGAQIADVWPEDEIRFEFQRIDRSVLAFRSGFIGDNLSTVFSDDALKDLKLEATENEPTRISDPAGKRSPTNRPKRKRRTRSIGLQKHALAA